MTEYITLVLASLSVVSYLFIYKLMKYFILDIETNASDKSLSIFNQNIKAPANIKDPVKIEEAIAKKKAGSSKAVKVDTDYADILCIGIKQFGGEKKLYTPKELEQWFKDNETVNYNKDGVHHDIQFITYNGKAFDIPLLIKTGIKQGLDYPYMLLNEMTNRYNNKYHIDLMLELGEYGKFKSLDIMLQIYLGISKTPIDFDTASDDEIKEHCLEDINNTELLYNKFEKLFTNL